MARKALITEPDIKNCLANNMLPQAIAKKYGVAPATVLKMIRTMNKGEKTAKNGADGGIKKRRVFDRKKITYEECRFTLKVGDIVSAKETEMSDARNEYRVIEIYENIYIGEKITGEKWCTAFRIGDFMKAYDPCTVRFVRKEGDVCEEG